MGQTLTHGVYLPDEGERNCYSGLAANWQILDTSVGTIAAHTAALAGKAPLVHTHSKADITDLLNSNFIPSANNSYDLGSSSYQWNNIYSKGYYYNGVAWGLDKANVWTTYNTFTGDARPIRLRGSNNDIYNVQPQNQVYSQIDFVDKNNKTMSYILFQHRTDATETHRICLRQNRITLDAYYSVDFNNLGDFYPEQNNAINLGTSTNKWKSLNGINPGALSLPDCQVTQSIDRTGWVYDGATYNPVLLSTTDSNMAKNGWLYVRMANTTSSDKLTIKYNSTADRYPTNTFGDVGGYIEVFVPVVANTNLYLLATKDLSFCKFYPCLGNVPSGV